MARYNTVSLFLTTSGTTAMTYAINNSFMTITGSSGITLTLVSPQYTVGYTQTFYNATGGGITIATPAGNIQGNNFTSASSQAMPANTTYSVSSDGTNYYILINNGGALSVTNGLTTDTLTVRTTATISPSGTVTISPSGVATINPSSLGSINNMQIGNSQPSSAAFTSMTANSASTITASTASTGTGSGALVITGGLGIQGATYGSCIYDNSNRVLTSVTVSPGTGISGGGTMTGPVASVTLNNTGVLSLTGTTGQIAVSASTGNITLTLPQTISSGAAPTFCGGNFSCIPNGALINNSITVSAGTGMSGGGTVALGSSITLNNAGVITLTGTSNQVSVSASTGNVTISLPQNINSGASPTFNGSNFSCLPAGNLCGATLNGNVTASSLTSVGTLSQLVTSGCVCIQSNLLVQGLMYTANCFCSAGAGLVNNLYSPNCFCVGGSAIIAGNTIMYGTLTVCGQISYPPPPSGSALYEGSSSSTNGGTQAYTWYAPGGVNSVSVVTIGAGAGGYYGWASCGGAGGGLSYSNGIGVSPGSGYTIQAGNGGCWSQSAGGYSCFPGVLAGGGSCGCCSGCGCIGGPGGPGTVTFPNTAGGGGGGGGYGPNQCWSNNSGHTGCYGGGGSANSHHSSTYGTGGGGGTGAYGQGSNGSCGRPDYGHANGSGGGGGSGGTCGYPGEPWSNGQGHGYNCGGNYGGGGGGSGTSHGGGYGGKGAVRIIWPGSTRSFPSGNAGSP